MKRREIKFVAGSLQLAPDRIEAAPTLRKSTDDPRKGGKAARLRARTPAAQRSPRKRR